MRAGWVRHWAVLCVLWALCAGAQSAESGKLIRWDRAQALVSDSESLPPNDTVWAERRLPDDWRHRAHAEQAVWYRLQWTLDQTPHERYLLYALRLRHGGKVYLNGAYLGEARASDDAVRVRWNRPHSFSIPPQALRAGVNTILLRVEPADDGDLGWVGRLMVGPDRLVRPLYEWRLLTVSTVPMMIALVAFLMGAFVLSIWTVRRMETLYGLFGAGVMCWGIRTIYYVWEVWPRDVFTVWRVLHYSALGGFVIVMALFMLRFVGQRNPLYERVALAYLGIGPLLMLAVGGPAVPYIDRYWQLGLIPLVLVGLYSIVRGAWRLRTVETYWVTISVALCVAAGIHDYFVAQGVLDLERTPWMTFANSMLLVVMAGLLVDRFIGALRTAENVNVVLEVRVAERERELAANYEKLRSAERQQVRMDERQRIMQDMHDGLGSQLLTSLGMIERGAIDTQGVAKILRESIDDLRLVIDMLTPEQSDFVAALGNLRYRLEPRFAAAGIRMKWNVRELPDRVDLSPELSLQVLRIMQECFANIAKHAQATEVAVNVHVREEGGSRLNVSVEDNGVGLPQGEVSSQSRGMANMRRRAEKLQAILRFPARERGTCVDLSLPLGSE